MPEFDDFAPEFRRWFHDLTVLTIRKFPKFLRSVITIEEAEAEFFGNDGILPVNRNREVAAIIAEMFFRRETVNEQ